MVGWAFGNPFSPIVASGVGTELLGSARGGTNVCLDATQSMNCLVRRLVWITFLFAFGGPQMAGAQPDDLDNRFSAANDAYVQGQYGQAVEAYHDVLRTGYESEALLYNLGNAYARLEQWGQAIRYYEKARRLRPDDSRITHNLQQVRREAGIPSGRGSEACPYRIASVVEGWSPLALYIAGWLFLLSGPAAMVLWKRRDISAVYSHPLVWGCITVGVIAIALALGTSYLQSRSQYAVVVADEVPYRVAPDQEATADSTLPEGTMLRVTRRDGQWREVCVPEGSKGWVSAEAVGEI